MILTLRLCKNYKNDNNLFDNENISAEHTFRISSSGILIRKNKTFKFIPTSLNQYYENDFQLCKDEVKVARINLSGNGRCIL